MIKERGLVLDIYTKPLRCKYRKEIKTGNFLQTTPLPVILIKSKVTFKLNP